MNHTEILKNQLRIGDWEKLSGFNANTLEKTIAVFGVGGSGSPMALTLTRMGFHRIILVDRDVVEPKNLTRQVLYTIKDVGNPKTDSALRCLKENHNYQSTFEAYQMDINLNLDKTEEIIKSSDFVFNLVDDNLALYHIATLCRKYGKGSIFFGTGTMAGMTSALMYQAPKEGCCIPCIRGLPTDLEKLKRQSATKNDKPLSASWYPTPALGAAFAASLLVKSLLDKKIDFNYALTSLYALQVDKLKMSGEDDCKICLGKR